MHTANKVEQKFIYITFILPHSTFQRVRRVFLTVEVYPENTSLSPGYNWPNVVDGGRPIIGSALWTVGQH